MVFAGVEVSNWIESWKFLPPCSLIISETVWLGDPSITINFVVALNPYLPVLSHPPVLTRIDVESFNNGK